MLGAELRAGARKGRLTAEHARSDLDDLLSRILAQAIAVLGGGAGSIALVDPDGSLRFRTLRLTAT